MDTELLKTFLEVSRTRHFGRAAESLYLTQSAVSFRIRQLENQLGVNLFTRHRNNIRLTAAGEKLLPYAETLMSTWQAARKEVAHTSRHNEFSIGASASLWECMLNQLLGYFTLALYTSAPSKLKGDLNYLRLEWGPDFQQHEAGLIGADEVPILTTSSAELAQQQIAMLNGCTWLPVSWARKKGGLHTVVDSTTLSRPLYAIWLQNSDKNTLIRDLLKINVLDEVY